MPSLTIKDIRKTLEETLAKFFSFSDYNMCPTEVRDDTQEFRIGFKIYNDSFLVDIASAMQSIFITRVCSNYASIHISLYPPQFRYNKERFDFGWRKDLEQFFDEFAYALINAVKESQRDELLESFEKDYYSIDEPAKTDTPEPNIKIGLLREDLIMKNLEVEETALYEEFIADAKVDESKVGECKIADKPSIFNSLKDDEEDEYI